MEFLKKVYHAVAAVLLMLVTSLIYGGYILEWRGKRPLFILIAAMAVTAVLIALVCRYLKKIRRSDCGCLYCSDDILFGNRTL